jgi:CPA2 family monovalent cation:H+ antiporter-2
VLLREPWAVLATLLVIVIGKTIAAWLIVRAFGYSSRTALLISASLAQIGEFSFILAGLGVALGILLPEARDLILAAAILSILVNPVLFIALDRWPAGRLRPTDADGVAPPARDHVVLVGHGRVGRHIAAACVAERQPFVVIESRSEALDELRSRAVPVMLDNAAAPDTGFTRAKLPLKTERPESARGELLEIGCEILPRERPLCRRYEATPLALGFR